MAPGTAPGRWPVPPAPSAAPCWAVAPTWPPRPWPARSHRRPAALPGANCRTIARSAASARAQPVLTSSAASAVLAKPPISAAQSRLVRPQRQHFPGMRVGRTRLGMQVIALVPEHDETEVRHRGEHRRARPGDDGNVRREPPPASAGSARPGPGWRTARRAGRPEFGSRGRRRPAGDRVRPARLRARPGRTAATAVDRAGDLGAASPRPAAQTRPRADCGHRPAPPGMRRPG